MSFSSKSGCTFLVQLDPEYFFAHYSRGIAYTENGDYDSAIKDLDRVIEIWPDNTYAYSARGDAYSKKGDREQAIADLDRAIELDPDFDGVDEARATLEQI